MYNYVKTINMKMKRICLILICLAAVFGCNAQTEKNDYVIESIMSRTSVRSYTDQTIQRKDLEKIVRAGMSAPTAVNKQPWAFVVIDDKNVMKRLAEQLKNASMLQNAAAAIVVCGDLSLALTGENQEYWIQDCSAATENILLAAHGMGYGAVWCGIYPNKERMKVLYSELSLPENVIPLNIIPIGVPDRKNTPKDKWKPERLHWNKW